MPVSKAQVKATNKYNAKAYDRIQIVVPKGQKAAVEAHASGKGESVNGLVNTLIRQDMGLTEAEWKTFTVSVTEKENIIDPQTMQPHDSREALYALDGLHEEKMQVVADTPVEAMYAAADQYEKRFADSRVIYEVEEEKPGK